MPGDRGSELRSNDVRSAALVLIVLMHLHAVRPCSSTHSNALAIYSQEVELGLATKGWRSTTDVFRAHVRVLKPNVTHRGTGHVCARSVRPFGDRHKRQSASTARLGAAAALMATVGLRVTGGCSCCRCPAGTVLGTVTAICSLLRTALLFKTRAEQQGVEDCYFYDVSFINLATVLQVGPILCAEAMIEMSMLTNMTAFDAVYPEESIAHKGY